MKIPIYVPELPPYNLVEPEIFEMYSSGLLYPSRYTKRLEDQVTGYQDCKHVLAVTSCSLGLMMLLSIVPKGSKVILPAFTFNATLQALEWNDLIPVVCDVDDNGQMDPESVRSCLDQYAISAIMPVHMWGNACYVEEYDSIADEYGVPVFYDGAHVFGTKFNNRQLGNFGDAVVFSIAATKPVSAGEGGLVCTNRTDVFEHVRDCATHGLYGSLDTRIKGTNGKIQEFNSILAYHAINMFEKTRDRRRTIIETYRSRLAGLPLRIWKTREKVDPSYKDCVLFTEDRDTREALDAFMNAKGIGTKRYFEPAIPNMGSFVGIDFASTNARKLSDTCLTIPLYPALTDEQIDYIIQTIRSFYV